MTITVMPRPILRTPIAARMPVLKVIGLGGGGCNAINRMIELGISGVDFITANTDCQALKATLAPTKIHLGPKSTRGLGAGGSPQMGEAAAEESYSELNEALAGADMIFLTAGMGGGTGTGSIPVAARVARATGAVVVAIVTTPFSFEVGRRQQNAREGLAKLQPFADTLITVPNDRLLQIASRDLSLEMAFRLADDVLRQGIQGISELITQPGMINVDFAHIRHLMQNGGGAVLSIGVGQGEDKALNAVENAIRHPLLDSINLENATGIIANFTGGHNLTFFEVTDALNYLQEQTNSSAEIIPGVINDERLGDRTQVILIVTGIGATPIDPHFSIKKPLEQEVVAPFVNPTPVMVNPEPVKSTDYFSFTDEQTSKPLPSLESPPLPTDIDIPAFLRRRIRN
jgi:cell division protein FtsZ